MCKTFFRISIADIAPQLIYKENIVLDIGCGTGEASNSLMQRLPSVKEMRAIDRSREFIEFAEEVNENADIAYQCMNAEDEWPLAWQHKYTLVS